jgi:polysaccharide export outer membrane protein
MNRTTAARVALALALTATFALATMARAGETAVTPAADASAPAPEASYRLQPGDALQITVWKESELTNEVLVRPDGGLSFPLAGDVQAAGHTVLEVQKMLQAKLAKYLPDPVVTVAVKATTGSRIFVVGKVNRAGDFPLNRPIDVMQALSLAGGTTPYADVNEIRVLRRDGDHQKVFRFRYDDVRRGRELSQNILLHSGDTVVVP